VNTIMRSISDARLVFARHLEAPMFDPATAPALPVARLAEAAAGKGLSELRDGICADRRTRAGANSLIRRWPAISSPQTDSAGRVGESPSPASGLAVGGSRNAIIVALSCGSTAVTHAKAIVAISATRAGADFESAQ